MKIVIPDDYQQVVTSLDSFALLAGQDVVVYSDMVASAVAGAVADTETMAERFREADALVLIRERTKISEPLLALLPNLRLISQTGKGIAHIDLAACTRHGVAVAAGGGSPVAPAELTWALVLAAMRFLPQEIAQLKAGEWQRRQPPLGRVLHGRALGIFGYGKIGRLVANYGRAFGMNILVWGREGSLARAAADGLETTTNRRDLFQRADVLSLHVTLNDQTRGMVTKEDLAEMKPSALLVNTGRAQLIAQGALVEALQNGRPGFAAVDVYEEEPVIDHPLLQMENVICTPHIGYIEKDIYELYFSTAFEQLLAFFGGNPINILNPEVLEKQIR